MAMPKIQRTRGAMISRKSRRGGKRSRSRLPKERRNLGDVRILLADDNEIVRKGLRHILTEALQDGAYGQASSPGEILRKVRVEKCNLEILGGSVHGRGVIEVLKDIPKFGPRS